jgi:eukaryotic-like serine/threonine-protein kinase
MRLEPGHRLGPYEILAIAGAGGMGEVYRARDTRLDRTVAIKVLTPGLACDAAFKLRFEREARLISSLNHPRICALHDIGHQDGLDYLVLEYIEGHTLAARLQRGALKLPQVLQYAIEIAEALASAHRLGIIHRDLKPGNIMVTTTGTKLVDFGLARPVAHGVIDISALTTAQIEPATGKGTFVGTLQYTSPEQIQGADPDVRTDIFAFGVVIYEMLTGKKAFDGKTPASIVAKILETDPAPVSAVVPSAPPALDHVVRLCLAKDPSERWQNTHDVLAQLRWIEKEGARADRFGGVDIRRRPRERLAWVVAVIVLAAAAAFGWGRYVMDVETHRPLTRADIAMPPNLWLPDFAGPVVSPDATRIVIPVSREGQAQLFVRRLDDTSFVPLAGTEGARGPFWSPDSRSIAFFAGGKLKRIDAGGGPITALSDGSAGVGGTWNRDGVILFAAGVGTALFQVPESGGAATQVTELDVARGDRGHRFPHFLPDNRTFLFAVGGQEGGIYAGSLDHKTVKRVLRDGAISSYVDPGFLVFVRQQTLMSMPFDTKTLEVTGPPQPVAERVRGGLFSVASNGTIAYATGGGDVPVQLSWFMRDGRRVGPAGRPGPYRQIALSPSGRRVAIMQSSPGTLGESDADLWLMDLTTGVYSRLTNDPAFDADPSWSPDERSLVFTSSRTGRSALFHKDLVTGVESQLVDFPERVVVDEWTPDGRFVIFRTFGRSVLALPMVGERIPKLLVDTPYRSRYLEDQTHVSPNGKWIAFNSDESGGWQVYVARFPEFSAKRQLSIAGGMQPLWRRDSRELFYLSPQGTLMAVEIGAGDTVEPGVPQPLFQVNLTPSGEVGEYGVTADGQRFLVAEPTSGSLRSMTFLFNWSPTAVQP